MDRTDLDGLGGHVEQIMHCKFWVSIFKLYYADVSYKFESYRLTEGSISLRPIFYPSETLKNSIHIFIASTKIHQTDTKVQ